MEIKNRIVSWIGSNRENFPGACFILDQMLKTGDWDQIDSGSEEYIRNFLENPKTERGEWHPLIWKEVYLGGVRYIQSGILVFKEFPDETKKDCQKIADWICDKD